MAVIKKTTNAGKDEDKIEYKLVQTLWKSAWRFLKKAKIELYDTAVLLKIYTQKNQN
jgi:hypothetical protein